MKDVLSHVQQCRNFCSSTEVHSSDPTLSLLILYEFEAQLWLNLPDALRVLDVVKMCPNVEPKIYENIAGTAKVGGACGWSMMLYYFSDIIVVKYTCTVPS